LKQQPSHAAEKKPAVALPNWDSSPSLLAVRPLAATPLLLVALFESLHAEIGTTPCFETSPAYDLMFGLVYALTSGVA